MTKRILLPAIFLLCTLCSMAYCDDVRLTSVKVQTAKANANLLSNGGFEILDANGMHSGWNWGKHNTDATCVVDESSPFDGRRCLKITNTVPLEPGHTALLSMAEDIAIEPGKTYTLSAWVKTNDAVLGFITGDKAWRYRAMLPNTNGKWKPVSLTFTADNADKAFNVCVQIESPTTGLWIDNVKFEEGSCATYDALPGGSSESVALWPENKNVEMMTDGAFSVPFALKVAKPFKGTINVSLSQPKKSITQRVSLKPGVYQVVVNGESNTAGYQPRIVKVSAIKGRHELASATTSVQFHSYAYTKAHLQSLKQKLPTLKANLGELKKRGQDVSYPMVSYTVLENFTGYAELDADKDELRRAVLQLYDMEKMESQLEEQLSQALAGKLTFAAVHRWTGDARPVIKSSSFIAPTVTPGKPGREMRPVFFTGYGHFGQVQADIEKFPNYGINIVQIIAGPWCVFPEEGRVDAGHAESIKEVMDRAQKAGVAANVLISLPWIPTWDAAKIRARGGDPDHYLRSPECRDFTLAYLQELIPVIKDHPALHSICLTNEPSYRDDASEYAVRDWHAYLAERHGDINTLNSRWGTNYSCFEEIKLPYMDKDANNPAGRRLDCVRWNDEFFEGWHKWVADAIHKIAPDLPVHAKTQTFTMLDYSYADYGNDAYLYGQATDINGNDSMNWYSFGGGEFAQGWMQHTRGHDLQRSVKDAPVFNSENHPIGDKEIRYIPGEQVRTTIWQEAIHGQSATTIWVWERTFDRLYDFAGSIMHRPACAAAAGLVNLDLNRAAYEVTALQQSPVQVQILQDTSASVLDGESYDTCSIKTYMALGFCGVKIGFITERQLEDGILPSAPVVFVPNARHLSDSAFRTLQNYNGRVVMVGDGLLTCNEYGQSREEMIPARMMSYIPTKTTARDLWKLLLAKLPQWGVSNKIEVTDVDGSPVWGVESKEAAVDDGTVINLCNYLNKPVSVRLRSKGIDIQALDVLTSQKVSTIRLEALEYKLVKVNNKARGI
ncbi:beta-galactosidase [bacterium]|nr:beta-galactosidase [bacterium]